jgi:hypothetical protein
MECRSLMPEHDPLRFATALSAKLATRSRHVCAFLGAGVASSCGLPDVAKLQDRVLADLGGDDRTAFTSQLEGRNIEQALSRVRRITALLTGDDAQAVDGLTAAQAAALDNAVCKAIVKALDIKGADLLPVYNLAAWAARADYRLPLELFTVNYDLLLETALERLRVPYFDGFIGSLRARFHTELVEGTPVSDGVPAFFVRLWKLHGSVNWAWDDDQQIVRLGQAVTEGRAAAIYPSDTKYEDSRRVPFVVLQDRLRRALQQPETLVLIAGYSFSDHHLNEVLFDAAARRERSEFVAFCHSRIPDALASRATTTTPNLQVVTGREAILGGVRAEWKPPEAPPPDLWDDGQLALRDFRSFAAYLARSTAQEPERDAVMPARPVPESDAGTGAQGNG